MMMNWYKVNDLLRNDSALVSLAIIVAFALLPLITRGQHTHIMTAGETAHYSTRDTIDNFFKRIQPLEVSIQLRDSSLMHLSPTIASAKLKEAMQSQGVSPDNTQKRVLQESMNEALRLSKPFTHIYPLPDTIRLGVIKGELYGPSVFYTREYGIYVPAPMIRSENKEILTRVLIHELFHIQSRRHPNLQEQLYKQLGFVKLKHPIVFPEGFLAQTLLNPDGTDWDYYIPLDLNQQQVLAFPLIVSSQRHFQSNSPNFFSYLKFQLYPLKEMGTTYYLEYSDSFDGLDEQWMPIFFEKITQNTNYIIHPDELMADNFILLTEWIEANKAPSKIDEDGRELLHKLSTIYQIELP